MASVFTQPLTLVTGVPGAGKTLYAIAKALETRATEGCDVYHIGIEGMDEKLIKPFIDVKEWRKLPPGAILLVDEAHQHFPQRAVGKPPEYIEKLSEVRHFGIRIVFLTQYPMQMDAFVRRLCGEHHHITRKAGLNGAMVRVFQGVSDDPDDYHKQKSSEQSPWLYPKHLFNVYKSSTLHVVHPKIPKKIIFAAFLLLLAPVVLYFAVTSVMDIVSGDSFKNITTGGKPPETQTATAGQPMKNQSSSPFGLGNKKEEITTPEQFVHRFTPLIKGIPWSAPAYVNNNPKTIPKLLCAAIGTPNDPERQCICYTEQVTKVDIDPASCENVVRNGLYDPFLQQTAQKPTEREKEV